jgi:hypothetical protein
MINRLCGIVKGFALGDGGLGVRETIVKAGGLVDATRHRIIGLREAW